MWFLQVNTFVGIFAIGLVLMITGLFSRISTRVRVAMLALMCTAFIGWVDLWLLGFYVVYIAAVFLLSYIIYKVKKAKFFIFVLGIIGCLAPLVFVRSFPHIHFIVVIGLAFAVLRGIDALFYTYYTGERVDFLAFYVFMVFVPTFTAGPVFRYRDFTRACENLAKVTLIDFIESVKRIIRGLFKIIVVVHLIMQVFEHFLDGAINPPISVLLVICSYLILYFNLDGYTDIAIALGRFCGFVVPENFKKPWRAASFTQFWRSWHSTVSDWIREHVFIFLHNKKLNKWQTAGVVVVVMAVMGLWHDFSLHVVLVATFYLGGLLAIETVLGLTAPKKTWSITRVSRCIAVNFLFGINTLLFITDFQSVQTIVRGFFRL